MACLSLE